MEFKMTVQELLSDESKWTKGTFARDENNCNIDPYSKGAICWCIKGAIMRCYEGDDEYWHANNEIRAAIAKLKYFDKPTININIMGFNDNPNTTFADIRRVIEEADI